MLSTKFPGEQGQAWHETRNLFHPGQKAAAEHVRSLSRSLGLIVQPVRHRGAGVKAGLPSRQRAHEVRVAPPTPSFPPTQHTPCLFVPGVYLNPFIEAIYIFSCCHLCSVRWLPLAEGQCVHCRSGLCGQTPEDLNSSCSHPRSAQWCHGVITDLCSAFTCPD